MAIKDSQVTDQTLKGAVIGAVIFFLAKGNVDPSVQAAIIPALGAVLAVASTKIGDPKVASFITTLAEKAPEIEKQVEEVVKVAKTVTATKAPAKKAVAKKAPAKKTAK